MFLTGGLTCGEKREAEQGHTEFLDGSRLLARHGRVIVEHASRLVLPERFTHLERTRLLAQGDASLSFYRFALAA